MEQYISKSALVAEIEDWRDKIIKGIFDIPLHGRQKADAAFEYEILGRVKDFIDTLEVKEVDLEEVIDGLTAGWIEGEEYGELQNINTCRCVTLREVKEAMRCMFELGLKAQKLEVAALSVEYQNTEAKQKEINRALHDLKHEWIVANPREIFVREQAEDLAKRTRSNNHKTNEHGNN